MSTPKTITITLPSISNLAPFILAVLGFFMVFTDINCNDDSIARFTGYDLVTGNGEKLELEDEGKDNEPNIWAILALTAGIAGIVLSTVLKDSNRRTGLLLTGLTGVAGMIALYFDIQSSIKTDNKESNSNNLDIDIDIQADMKFGYWFVLGCYVLAVMLNLSRPQKAPANAFDEVPENNS